jgi:hypothetical protein
MPSGGSSSGSNAVAGTVNDAGSPAAGETSLGGVGNQAGESSTSGGDGSGGAAEGGAAEGGAGPTGMSGAPTNGAGTPGLAGAPGEGGAPSCADTSTPRYVAGSLDGEDVDYRVYGGSAFSRNQPTPTLFDWRGRAGSDGLLHIWGPTPLVVIGASTTAQAHLVMASEGPNAGVHYCAGSGTVQRISTFRHTGSLSNWTELGTCPNNPGTGSLAGCHDETSVGAAVVCGSDQFRLVGDIGNTAIDASYVVNTVNKEGSSDANYFFAFGNGGLMMLHTVSNVGSGYMMLPDDGPSPGLILCIGSATVTPGVLSNHYTFTLGSLGVVGTCPGATGAPGTLEGCL